MEVRGLCSAVSMAWVECCLSQALGSGSGPGIWCLCVWNWTVLAADARTVVPGLRVALFAVFAALFAETVA